jgi:hypothetical protein
MSVTKDRIFQYAHQHNHLPASLSELPPAPGYDTATTDAWGRPIDYSFDSSGDVTLRSLGADKQVGGDGDKRDVIGTFATRDTQGRWLDDQSSKWTLNPMHR